MQGSVIRYKRTREFHKVMSFHWHHQIHSYTNKGGQPNQSDETLIAPESFTFKLAFCIHNPGEKICQKKIDQSPNIF